MAIEEAAHTVATKEDTFEIRDCTPHVVAETLAEGTLAEAGTLAFNRLFRYVSGGKRSREKAYGRNLEEPESWMRGKGLSPAGDPVWTRHDSPFPLWFLRHNEILIPVATTADRGGCRPNLVLSARAVRSIARGSPRPACG